jgi:tetratricopeptide (TPR) repeat protein
LRQPDELSFLLSGKLIEKDPENVVYQSDVARTLNNLGVLLWNMGRFEEAKQSYEKAFEVREVLLKVNSENVMYQSDVAMTLNNFGNLLGKMGHFEEAKEKYKKSLEIYERILETDSENVTYQSHVGSALNNLGFLFYDMGHFEEAKEKYKKSLEIYERILETDPENVTYQSHVAMALNNFANLLRKMRHTEEDIPDFEHLHLGSSCGWGEVEGMRPAKQMYEKALKIYENLLETDPQNVKYQSDVGMAHNNLGVMLYNMQHFEEAKKSYEKALEIYENLLKTDPVNVQYQTDVGMALNNLGSLLKEMELIEDAKKIYERELKIYTEPMQHLSIIRKSNAIIKLIELNREQAERETNSYYQIKHLKEVYHLCKKNQEFFSKYGLKHEKNLVMEAGFSAYVDYIIKNIRCEKDPKKRVVGYEEAIKAIEKMGKIGNEEEVSKMASSSVCYLKGRKLVNEALGSEQPDLELIKEAANQFRNAKDTYKRANVCYCIYIGLFKVLENVAIFEDENGKKAKKLIQQIIETFPEKTDPSIKASFEEITKLFDERDVKSRRKHLEKFDGKIRAIEYKALENLFGHVQKKLKDYIEEPFSPNLFYSNWKLRIAFDAERITGKLKVKTGNTILFDRALNKDEIKNNAIEIDYLDKKYIPCGEDVIIFETPNQKPVVRDTDYLETISKNKKVRIFCHNCCNDVCAGGDLRIAVVQLRYDVYGEDYAVKILASDDYKRKVMAVLEAVQE